MPRKKDKGSNNQHHDHNRDHGHDHKNHGHGHNHQGQSHDNLFSKVPHLKHDLRDRAKLEMALNGLRAVFSPEVHEQVVRLLKQYDNGQGLKSFACEKTRDLRHLLWSSIDNQDSRDLDQIEFVERTSHSSTKVLIAIADVDSFAAHKSPIDESARQNTTSVYMGVINFPMLPDELSYDMTSLLPGQERLAVVYELHLGNHGHVVDRHVYRAFVTNKAQLDYKTIGLWLDGKIGVPREVAKVKGLTEQLLLQNHVKQQIFNLRQKHGSLFLRTVEARAVAVEGQVLDLELVEENPARDLIENFMIAANVAVSAYLDKKGFPSIKRIVRTPDRWPKIVELAAAMGSHLPQSPDAPALQSFLLKMRDRDPLRFPDLSLRVVKLLGKGEYVLDPPGENNPGHFALAVNDYTHSTAPNRRYVDLITQRLLKAAMDGKTCPYSFDELSDLALECTRKSSLAKKVERTLRKVAAASLLGDKIGNFFDGIVTGVKDEEVYVRLLKPPAEGRIVEGAEGLEVGDEVRLKLLMVDEDNAFIDFACVH